MRFRSSLGVPSALPMPPMTKVATSTHTASEFAPRDVRMS